MIRIAYVITGLGMGGAETMLYKLLSHTDRTQFAPQVFSLMEDGPIGAHIRELDIPVRCLGMRQGSKIARPALTLAHWLKQEKPDIVQTWMYHADLLGGLAAHFAGRVPVVWGIRNTSLDPGGAKRATRMIRRVCAKLSHWLPRRIVCCAEAARREHALIGYAPSKLTVIPNGFDLLTFHPDEAAREDVRKELGVAPDTVLIGIVGRFHPQKDHGTFVAAAARLHKAHPKVHFVMCGNGLAGDNASLVEWINEGDIRNNVHLLGSRRDIPRLTAAFDIASLTSYSEAFPNVLGEAMACAVPCVATDAGDSALILGNIGEVVPTSDPVAFALGWEKMLALGHDGRKLLGDAARERVRDRFSLPVIARQYGNLYQEIVTGCAV